MMASANVLIRYCILFNCITQVLLLECGVPAFRVSDLTHEHNASTVFYPGYPVFNFTIQHRGKVGSIDWLEANSWQVAEHGGTHLDVPAHFAQNKSRLHEIPLEKLIGPGVIINVKKQAAHNPDYQVTIADLNTWESNYGTIPVGAVVIMNSGWTYKYPDKVQTFGTQHVDDPSTYHFPGWHEDTIDWLVENRNVHVVGVDTPSNDYGKTLTFAAHKKLAAASIIGVENVANLDSIPQVGTMIFVAALKMHGASGGPVRIFATHNEQPITSETCH